MTVVLLNEKMLPVPLSPILKDLSTYQFRQQQEAGIYQSFPSIVDNKLHMLLKQLLKHHFTRFEPLLALLRKYSGDQIGLYHFVIG